MKKFKKERGVTLVILAITVIILTILLGVTFSLTIGDEGILTQTHQKVNSTEEAINDEKAYTNNLSDLFDNSVNRNKVEE